MARMHITGGARRGFPIIVPRGRAVRPTPAMARQALFNILGPLDGEVVLEMFAGAGTLGLEALSRGAAHALFVEASAGHVDVIARNVASLGMEDCATILRADAYGALPRIEAEGRTVDILFLDPPYEHTRSLSPGARTVVLIESLGRSPCVGGRAVLILQHPRTVAFELAPEGWTIERVRSYGSTSFTFLRRQTASA